MTFDRILAGVGQYYGDKIRQHGPTHRGVDWNSRESQELRYEQLLKILDADREFSINDYGCGYGGLAQHLSGLGYDFRYSGFDISSDMIAVARDLNRGRTRCEFFTDESSLTVADYTVASGIFNVRLQIGEQEWEQYVLHVVDRLAALSGKGFAFNMLTSYSDPDRMRPDLYYADPRIMFDHCKRRYSRFVSVLHDYPLYEFTVIVRR